MFMIFFLALALSVILIVLNSSISTKSIFSREKISPFECGYDPKSMSRLPFSLHFYLLAVIFLIFDVEITIIIPMPILFNWMEQEMWLGLTLLFILILIVGTIHEWNEGSLDWQK
uniref:NADH-ubiquinone oxidoreductase chain 3 n=1 Tax=Dicyrtomina saundersi TaxID=438492 RepID=A0A516EZT6_9HEXA|nr:NADH dehydrogenase subunit 3 [Dicyrtomina saundersi]QDO72015.1 NADH dehydrogenase subunit 3 [Dicyrtomina saundersi]